MNSDDGMSIAILVVSDDLTCENRVAEVLQRCDYRVLRSQTVNEALRELYGNRERLDLVITNLNKLEAGLATIQIINQTLKLNVLSIPSDERIHEKEKGLAAPLCFSVYIVKGMNLNSAALKNLMGNTKGVGTAAAANYNDEQQNNTATPAFAPINANDTAVGGDENVEKAEALGTNAASSVEAIHNKAAENVKRAFGIGTHDQLNSSSLIKDVDAPPRKGKKPRVTWTDDMHNKFLEAIQTLGDAKAVPNKILELMRDFPELTRENVASHLQKHRYSNNAQKSSK